MTKAQLALIREQHAVWSRSEIDCNSVKLRLERQIEELRNAAEREQRAITGRALKRISYLRFAICNLRFQSSSGTISLARPLSDTSTVPLWGVTSGLISATNAPASLATAVKPAAG